MGNEQDFIPGALLEKLRRLNLDTQSLKWDFTYEANTVVLNLQWLKCEHDYNQKKQEPNVDSSCVESTFKRSLTKLNGRKQLKQSWSKWKAKKGYTKKRIGNKCNKFTPLTMGKDVKSSKSVLAVPSAAALDVECLTRGTVEKDSTDINEHTKALEHSSVTLSPECTVSCSTVSSSSSSKESVQESSSNSSIGTCSSTHHFSASFLPYNYGHKQKTLKFAKEEETLSDGELSESLPDLDDTFPDIDGSVNDLSYNSEVHNKLNKDAAEIVNIDRNVEKVLERPDSIEQIGKQKNSNEKGFIGPNKELKLLGNAHVPLSRIDQISNRYIGDKSFLVSPEVKNKIANLLQVSGKVESKSSVADSAKCSKDDSSLENSVQANLSGERHFLDVLISSPSKRMKLINCETDSANTEDTSVRNTSLRRLKRTTVKNLSPSDGSSPKSPTLKALQETVPSDKAMQQQRTSWSVKRKRHSRANYRQLSINTYMKQNETVSESLPLISMAKTNDKIFYPSFIEDFALPDDAVYSSERQLKFSPVELSAIDAVIEEGSYFMKHTIDLTQAFSLYNMPTKSVVNHIYKTGLLESTDITKSLRSFHTLSYIQRKYPSAIRITWAMISDVMDKLGLDGTAITTDRSTIFRSMLALQFIVQVLRGELRAINNISNSTCIKKCQAYKVLSSDCAMNNLKQVMKWISGALTCGEYEELCDSYIHLNFDDTKVPNDKVLDTGQLRGDLLCNELKKVLPYLQELLEIGILVSSSNLDCARRLGFELVKTFYYLPNLESKKLLLQTMTSDLLRFKLCELFMEANCEMLECCFEFPTELVELTDRLFQTIPPKCQLTPPLTPSSDCLDDQELDLSLTVSRESCEELCMLQYYAILSYMRCRKSECFKALRRRGSLEDKGYQLNMDDKQELQCNWECSVETQRLKVLQWTANVTPATEMFLNMMLCLGDAT